MKRKFEVLIVLMSLMVAVSFLGGYKLGSKHNLLPSCDRVIANVCYEETDGHGVFHRAINHMDGTHYWSCDLGESGKCYDHSDGYGKHLALTPAQTEAVRAEIQLRYEMQTQPIN